MIRAATINGEVRAWGGVAAAAIRVGRGVTRDGFGVDLRAMPVPFSHATRRRRRTDPTAPPLERPGRGKRSRMEYQFVTDA